MAGALEIVVEGMANRLKAPATGADNPRVAAVVMAVAGATGTRKEAARPLGGPALPPARIKTQKANALKNASVKVLLTVLQRTGFLATFVYYLYFDNP